jgi:plasmid maintenance system antidote protein VapI
MDANATKKRGYPKDWERRSLVKVELAKRNMTITDLASSLSMNRGYVSDLISGVRRSPLNERKIATFFGLRREDLFPIRTRGDLETMRERGQAA